MGVAELTGLLVLGLMGVGTAAIFVFAVWGIHSMERSRKRRDHAMLAGLCGPWLRLEAGGGVADDPRHGTVSASIRPARQLLSPGSFYLLWRYPTKLPLYFSATCSAHAAVTLGRRSDPAAQLMVLDDPEMARNIASLARAGVALNLGSAGLSATIHGRKTTPQDLEEIQSLGEALWAAANAPWETLATLGAGPAPAAGEALVWAAEIDGVHVRLRHRRARLNPAGWCDLVAEIPPSSGQPPALLREDLDTLPEGRFGDPILDHALELSGALGPTLQAKLQDPGVRAELLQVVHGWQARVQDGAVHLRIEGTGGPVLPQRIRSVVAVAKALSG